MRVEILGGVERRRQWSRDEKMRIIEETLAPGAKVSEVARKHGIVPSLVFAWRRRARVKLRSEESLPPLIPVHVVSSASNVADEPLIASEPLRLPRSGTKKNGLIEIDLGGGKRIRVDAEVDADALGRVLDVLGRR
jgi:transposase